MTQDAIDRAAHRLMNLRPSENTVNPYKLVSAAVNALIDKRCTDPLAHIPVVTTKDLPVMYRQAVGAAAVFLAGAVVSFLGRKL